MQPELLVRPNEFDAFGHGAHLQSTRSLAKPRARWYDLVFDQRRTGVRTPLQNTMAPAIDIGRQAQRRT